MSTLEVVKAIVSIIGSIFIPVAILVVGQLFRRQREQSDTIERARKEKSEAAQRDADRVALLLKHLASDNPRERLLAIHFIKHLRDTKRFPEDLLSTITYTAFSDRPDIAAAAQMVVGVSGEIPDEVVLNELLAPLKVNFDRSKQSFDRWKKQDLFLEEIIHDSNLFARDLLISKSHMIPTELLGAASKLVDHYNAWLKKYDEVRPNGVRDPKEPFVFVGIPPINKEFPREAVGEFVDCFKQLTAASKVTMDNTTSSSP